MQLESHPILLELLQEFDAICCKHNIKYFLSAGTRLGAIRNGGFIPWDDDADVILTLEEYKKFLKVINQELPANRGYYDANLSPFTWRRTHGRYTNTNTTYFAKHQAFLNLEFGCRIDVFVQLPVPDDEKKRDIFIRKVRDWENFLYLKTIPNHSYSAWRYLYFQLLSILLGRERVEKKLFERLTLSPDVKSSKYLEAYEPRDSFFDSNSFEDHKYVPFENIELPVPIAAEYTLQERYGDWRELPPVDKRKSHHGGTQDCKRPYKEYADDFFSYINAKKWARNWVIKKFLEITILRIDKILKCDGLHRGGVWFLRNYQRFLKRLQRPCNRYIERQMLISKRPQIRFKLFETLVPQKDYLLKLFEIKNFEKIETILEIYKRNNNKFLKHDIPFCFDKELYQMLTEMYKCSGSQKKYNKMLQLKNEAFAYLEFTTGEKNTE